jgi:hypothetical protein
MIYGVGNIKIITAKQAKITLHNNHGSDKQVDAPDDSVSKNTETRRAR